MSRRRPRSNPTFAAIVDDLRRHPTPEPDLRARLRAPDGRSFVETDEELTPEAAQALAAAGAVVAWDSCGCQGYCGLEWFDPARTARLVADGPPELVPSSRKMPHVAGRLSAWRSDDGQMLVLATREVRWGRALF